MAAMRTPAGGAAAARARPPPRGGSQTRSSRRSVDVRQAPPREHPVAVRHTHRRPQQHRESELRSSRLSGPSAASARVTTTGRRVPACVHGAATAARASLPVAMSCAAPCPRRSPAHALAELRRVRDCSRLARPSAGAAPLPRAISDPGAIERADARLEVQSRSPTIARQRARAAPGSRLRCAQERAFGTSPRARAAGSSSAAQPAQRRCHRPRAHNADRLPARPPAELLRRPGTR